MFYADEISEDVAYKLIEKLNKIRDKTKYSWERWKNSWNEEDVYLIEDTLQNEWLNYKMKYLKMQLQQEKLI